MVKACNTCKHYTDAWTDCAGRGCTADGLRTDLSKWEPADGLEEPSTRSSILEQAIKCVCTDRDTQYGSPEYSFKVIAKLWNTYLGFDRGITAHDVGIMMALLKIARIKTGQFKEDSYIDAAGYIACAAQCKTEGHENE